MAADKEGLARARQDVMRRRRQVQLDDALEAAADETAVDETGGGRGGHGRRGRGTRRRDGRAEA